MVAQKDDFPLKRTALYEAHVKAKAKMCPFAGYEMPLQYKGVKEEHLHTREAAGLFDVSHMGQAILHGEGATETLCALTPSPLRNTVPGKSRYTVLCNASGGILDDLIVTRLDEDTWFLVVNGACKAFDFKWLRAHLVEGVQLDVLSAHSLIALQGPRSVEVLTQAISYAELENQPFMTMRQVEWNGTDIFISRSGYTGEDGFEISLPDSLALSFWEEMLRYEHVQPVGLAARDSLRLEAGLPLYGQDLDETTSPIEAGLDWIVARKSGDYFGAARIHDEMHEGTDRIRVGVEMKGKPIARAGAAVLNEQDVQVGCLTSGGYGPSVQKGIGQGYVEPAYSASGTPVWVEVRGKKHAAFVHGCSFIKHKVFKKRSDKDRVN